MPAKMYAKYWWLISVIWRTRGRYPRRREANLQPVLIYHSTKLVLRKASTSQKSSKLSARTSKTPFLSMKLPSITMSNKVGDSATKRINHRANRIVVDIFILLLTIFFTFSTLSILY